MRPILLTLVLAASVAASASAATPKPAAGGSMQRSSTEGCLGQMLFNGVWRVRVLSVDPAAAYNDGSAMTGIGVRVQIRNGTSRELAPDDTGFSDINGRGIDLAYDDENTVDAVSAGTNLSETLDRKLPPGGASTFTIYFPYGPEKNAKPAKLLIAVDQRSSSNHAQVKYSTSKPSYRIDLTCT